MLQLNSLRLDQVLLSHEALLLEVKVADGILQVADLLVQEVSRVVLVCYVRLQLG